MRNLAAPFPPPLMLSLALALASCSNHPGLPLPGTLMRDRIDLAAEAAEPLLEILVREGDAVVAGQLLLRLDPARAQTQVDLQTANRRGAERKLDELTRGPRREAVQELQAQYDGAEQQLAVAERELLRVRDLLARKLSSDADLDRSVATRDAARTARDAARARLAAALKGTTIEELDQARAALAAADASLAAAVLSLERLSVHAPVAGTVESLPFELGERPLPGTTVVSLLASGRLYARVFVPEPLRARVSAGLAATIVVDGQPATLAGTVRYISSAAAYTPYFSLTEHDRSRLSYLAEIDVTMPDVLPAGVPVTVDFPSLRD